MWPSSLWGRVKQGTEKVKLRVSREKELWVYLNRITRLRVPRNMCSCDICSYNGNNRNDITQALIKVLVHVIVWRSPKHPALWSWALCGLLGECNISVSCLSNASPFYSRAHPHSLSHSISLLHALSLSLATTTTFICVFSLVVLDLFTNCMITHGFSSSDKPCPKSCLKRKAKKLDKNRALHTCIVLSDNACTCCTLNVMGSF